MADAVPVGGIEQAAAFAAQLVCLRAELASHRAGRRGRLGWRGLNLQTSAACSQKSLQRRQGRKSCARLISGQCRLGGAGARGQIYLREIRVEPRLAESVGYRKHEGNYINIGIFRTALNFGVVR
jgi:hypothetical protein